MKKTLTVNLNNIVFHIDDDAYEMLQTYLSEVSDHFKSEDERKEIMNDIEARIAELFNEKLQKNKNVINVEDVQKVIEIMGKPNQYAADDEDAETPKNEKKQQQQRSRRFYRDPENAILGGIAGGLAAYLGWDVTLIRILLVVLVFLGVGFIIPVYIVVWFVAPQAVTASQRLEMQGEDVTVDSIKAEMNNAKNYIHSDKFKQSATTVGEKMMDVLRVIFKVMFGLVGGILGFVGIILIGALITLLMFLIFQPAVVSGFFPDLISNWTMLSPEKMVMLVISLILLIGSPIFLIVFWAIRLISGRRDPQTFRTTSWVVLILWVAGMFMFYSFGAKALIHWHNTGQSFSFDWTDDKGPFVDQVRTCDPFDAVEVSGNIELTITKDSVNKLVVSAPDDYLPKLVTKVDNGVLRIYADHVLINRTVKVQLSADSLRMISATGACRVSTRAPLNASSLDVEMTGASDADLDVSVQNELKVNLRGASKTNVTGHCQTFRVSGLGASEVNAKSLIAKDAFVTATGASHVDLFASERLDADATGASEINCKGNPKIVNKSDHLGSSVDVE